MRDFDRKMIQEKKELDGRIKKLREFLTTDAGRKVSGAETARIIRQLQGMDLYKEALGERTEAAGLA